MDTSFLTLAQEYIDLLPHTHSEATVRNHRATLASFRQFLDGEDPTVGQLTSTYILLYETHLTERGVCRNTVSFYLRTLRTIYNKVSPEPKKIFADAYTGFDKTRKRAITRAELRRLTALDLTADPSAAFARDMFLFSLYTQGMPFIDMAHLKKDAVQGDSFAYTRRKTGGLIVVGWTLKAQAIVDRYAAQTADMPYLLPLLTPNSVYRSVIHRINRNLKRVGERAKIDAPLTMYVARHTWATLAYQAHTSLRLIAACMGHANERITQVYLADTDNSEIVQLNKKLVAAM